jgi:hypothetical protein
MAANRSLAQLRAGGPSAGANARELLNATEKALVKIRAMTERKRNPRRGKDTIALKLASPA